MFPDELKLVEIVLVYKKNDKKDKSNYRPVNILSNISNIYEICIQTQLNEYFANFLLKFQCGFRQGFSTQHCLLVMIEINSFYFRVLQKPKTENKNWVHLQ